MQRMCVSRALLLLAVSCALNGAPPPPVAERKPVTDTLHGDTLTDPYRWLEDQNSPETRAWIEREIAYTDQYFAALHGREALRKRLEPLFRTDVYSAPAARGNRYFFSRRLAGENRASLCLREGLHGKDQVLIAPDSISPDPSVSISIQAVSDDGKLLLYAVRRGGEDETEVRFFDVEARRTLPGAMPRARRFGVALTPDARMLYYSRLDKDGTHVYAHTMGESFESDKAIFGRGRGLVPTDSVSISEDGRYLLLALNYGTSSRNEVRFLDLQKGGPVLTVVEGIDAQFRARIEQGQLFLTTNWKAPNWRVLKVDLAAPSLDKAKEIIAERDIVLSGTSFAGGRIFASYLENVQPRVYVYDTDGKPLGEVKPPALGSMSLPFGRWSSKEAFFGFSSFAEPGSTWRLDLATMKRDLWYRTTFSTPLPPIETRQVWYASKDGTKIPMWLVFKKGLRLDGNRPVYLTGYGGFNLSRLAAFAPTAVVWAEMNGVYALPNLRGGGEFGEKWHRAGMFGNKQNVFDDFAAAAEWLIQNRYTSASRIAVSGGSNGGLLVGAMLTQHPGLVGAVLCSYPLLDMIRYQRTLLGRFWVSEYGSSENAEQFRYLLKYSPYQNVKPGIKYPAVMFLTGDSDTRVDPMHARKMAALMQSLGGPRTVLLHYDTKSGHSGGRPVDQQIADTADELLFLLREVGVEVP
jgi:prolyl oligopeptidase